jgi:hypothetical protein
MPRDVATRWNFTHTMLEFAGEYRSALELITGDRNSMLRSYELDDAEWSLVEQLYNVLEVRGSIISYAIPITP